MSGIAANSIAKTCFFWNRNGECKHGEGCHFLHRKTGIIADPPKSWTDYSDRGRYSPPYGYMVMIRLILDLCRAAEKDDTPLLSERRLRIGQPRPG